MRIRSEKDNEGGTYIENLSENYVENPDEFFALLKEGKKNRSVGRTNMNLVSSRSHLIVSITLHQKDTEKEVAKTGKLLMVDLAGSEKVSKTGAEGKLLMEAK